MEKGAVGAGVSAGAKLLNRAIAPDYLVEQTAQVARVEQLDLERTCSALIFRLGAEWLAIPSGLCQQILSPIAEHTLPHRSNATLLGLVNVRGQLLLKISLLSVLGLVAKKAEQNPRQQTAVSACRRMVIVSKVLTSGAADTWTFDVDEIYGIQAVPLDDLQPAAAGVVAASSTCTQYLLDWQGRRVSFLDDIKLLERVRRQAL